jgi:heme oxygenase
MLSRIGRDTRSHHATADGDRLALMDVASVAEYRAFLARIYGFEDAVESAVAGLCDRDMISAGTRSRLESLRADLVWLGAQELDSVSRYRGVFVRTAAEALGWLFVIERQTLLAGLIRRYLANRIPNAVPVAARFLDDASRNAGVRFRRFGDALAALAQDHKASVESIAMAAASAFRHRHVWYARIGRRSPVPPRGRHGPWPVRERRVA